MKQHPDFKEKGKKVAIEMKRYRNLRNSYKSPKFWPKNHRQLKPLEKVRVGDYYWSVAEGCWLPATKSQLNDIAGTYFTFVRRSDEKGFRFP